MKRDGKRGEMRDVGAAGECWGRVGSGHAFGHELFARFFGLGTCNCTMYRASPPTRTTTTTADSARGTAGRSHSRTCFIIMPKQRRARASSQGQATMSPAEADLRPSLVAVAGPSPKRARASSHGQATMSPAEADLRETRRPRRKRARASPELRKVRRMYTKGVMRILRWGHQQGHRHRSPHVHRRRGTVVGTEAGKSTLSVLLAFDLS